MATARLFPAARLFSPDADWVVVHASLLLVVAWWAAILAHPKPTFPPSQAFGLDHVGHPSRGHHLAVRVVVAGHRHLHRVRLPAAGNLHAPELHGHALDQHLDHRERQQPAPAALLLACAALACVLWSAGLRSACGVAAAVVVLDVVGRV